MAWGYVRSVREKRRHVGCTKQSLRRTEVYRKNVRTWHHNGIMTKTEICAPVWSRLGLVKGFGGLVQIKNVSTNGKRLFRIGLAVQ